MLDRNNELNAFDRDHFFHPSTHMGTHARGESPTRIIKTGHGATIVDRDGKESLDAFAGLYCVNVGYGRKEIAEAIADQARELSYYHAYAGHGSEASITLARMVMERAPEGMARVYFGLRALARDTGTDVEILLREFRLRVKPPRAISV